ncbi:hypothetical protein Btru_043509, partial [Bulinus truncatus]
MTLPKTDGCPCSDPNWCKPIEDVPDKEVFAFSIRNDASHWELFDWSKLTTVVTFGYINSKLTCLAHSHNVKVVILGYVTFDIFTDATKRQQWIEKQLLLVKQNFLDGINFDFEGQVGLNDTLVRDSYTALISVDVGWKPNVDIRFFDYQGLADAADLLFVMAYDEQSQIFGECIAGPNSAYKSANIANKLILRVPWYGYIYKCIQLIEVGEYIRSEMFGALPSRSSKPREENTRKPKENFGCPCFAHFFMLFINMALANKIQLLTRLHSPLVLCCQNLRMFSSLTFDKAFVNGKWISANSGKTFEVLNPANGQVLGSVPDMDESDVQAAIKAAHTSFQPWKNTLPKERGAIMKRWGASLAETEGEILYGSGFLEWFGEECRRTYGDVIPTPVPSKRTLVIKQPIGVAGMITPWNFPNAMVTRKAGAAIAAGCTVVLRPAEDTPFSALALCKLAEEAGLPPGVLNVVTSDRGNAAAIGKELCENPLVSKISFTGSTAVGKLLLSQSASTVKKVSLELGGNAPFIVFDSADLQKAVNGAIVCKFRNAGQTCVCANRILVQDGIYDKFVHALALAIGEKLKTGNGLDPEVNQGPLINSRAVEK